MKGKQIVISSGLILTMAALTACGGTSLQEVGMTVKAQAEGTQTATSPVVNAMQVRVHDAEGHTLTLQLNDSKAAKSLYEQLPLTIALENYSDNEKIFYPPAALDTDSAPLAEPGTTTVAYYKPWGDVVFFYGPYRANNQLFALGTVAEGSQGIAQLVPGTVTIEKITP